MKLISFSLVALLLMVSSSLYAQTKKKHSSEVMKGYLIDKMCGSMMAKKTPDKAMAAAAKHTKACATEEGCAASGYGIMMDGKWTPFDDEGNKKAAEYLKKTKAEDNIYVAVGGTLQDGKVKVFSIKEIKVKVK